MHSHAEESLRDVCDAEISRILQEVDDRLKSDDIQRRQNLLVYLKAALAQRFFEPKSHDKNP